MADIPQRLEQRLEDTVRAWLSTDPVLGKFSLRERDENALVFPEGALPRPIIIVEAKDEGRAAKMMPIRNIRLSIIVRANTKAPGGSAESFSAIGGALDGTNLVVAWSGTRIAVMLAVRTPGIQVRSSQLVREGTVAIECKCVAAERTVQGTGVMPPAGG